MRKFIDLLTLLLINGIPFVESLGLDFKFA